MANKINDTIAELLHEHDCVIIPGFGGFVSRRIAAQISPGNGVLYPASKSILFNKHLTNNDGLLANHLIHKFGISYSQALTMSNEFAQDLQDNLNKNLRVEVERIGTFYLDKEKIIQFEACVDFNFLPESFGLFPVTLRKIETEVISANQKNKIDRTQPDNEKPQKLRSNILKTAAIVGPVCILLGFMIAVSFSPRNSFLATLNPFSVAKTGKYSLKKFQSNISSENSKEEENKITLNQNGTGTLTLNGEDKIIFVYVGNETDLTTKKGSIKEEILSKSNPYNPPPKSRNFEIIIGCFKDKNNADRMKKTAVSQSFTARIIGQNENDLYVVSAGGCTELDSAVSLLEHARVLYPDAWVLKK